jgi:hypothetical protein
MTTFPRSALVLTILVTIDGVAVAKGFDTVEPAVLPGGADLKQILARSDPIWECQYIFSSSYPHVAKEAMPQP